MLYLIGACALWFGANLTLFFTVKAKAKRKLLMPRGSKPIKAILGPGRVLLTRGSKLLV